MTKLIMEAIIISTWLTLLLVIVIIGVITIIDLVDNDQVTVAIITGVITVWTFLMALYLGVDMFDTIVR